MKCYYCKRILADGSAFCSHCGQPQTVGADLLLAARMGDQEALTDLYNRTSTGVYNTIRFIVKDEDNVLDIMQDTYIKAFDSLDQLQKASKFEPWIKRIAHNKAIDYLRRSKPLIFSEMVPDDSDEVLQFEDVRPDVQPAEVADQKETARLIKQILDSLPEDQRACIALYYYDQLSVKEIAQVLQIPEATVKSRLQYGRRKIETQVRELEHQGTKLYSMAPIPFFLALLRTAGSADAPAGLLQGVLAGGGTTAAAGSVAGKAVGAAVQGTAKAAAGATVKTAIASKILVGVALVTVLGGGTTAAVVHYNRQVEQEQTVAEEAIPIEPTPEELMPEPPEEPPMPEESSVEESSVPEESSEVEEEPIPEEKAPVTDGWQDAYQQVLDGYQMCMSEGLGGSSPYLEYIWVQRTLEVQDGSRVLRYALHDVNHDGLLELVLAMEQAMNEEASELWYTPFEIYTFDGTQAVPLFLDHTMIDEDHTLEIWAAGGLSVSTLQAGQTYYSLPAGGAQLQQLEEYLPQFDEKVDQELAYQSILTPIQSAVEELQAEGFSPEMIAYIKEQLLIPEDLETEDRIDYQNATYWDPGEQWLVSCAFYHDGQLIASALVDRETGELVRDIMVYTGE